MTLTKDASGKYAVTHECLSGKKATSRNDSMDIVYEVSGGEIVFISGINEHSKFSADIQSKTMNLLETATMCALFYEKFLLSAIKNQEHHRGGTHKTA